MSGGHPPQFGEGCLSWVYATATARCDSWWTDRVYFLAFSIAGPDPTLTARSTSLTTVDRPRGFPVARVAALVRPVNQPYGAWGPKSG
jgi:hypothetical protein